MLLSFALGWAFIRRLDLTAGVCLLSWYVGFASMAAVYFTGTPLNAVLWTLPTLVSLLNISASLHFLAYYRAALQHDQTATLETARRLATRPILYCSLTTSAGLSSLLFSETEPVRQFGAYGTAAILLSCAIVLYCFPGWLLFCPAPTDTGRHSPVRSIRWWTELARFTQRRRGFIFCVTGCVVVVSGFWLSRLTTSVNIRHLFPGSSDVITNTHWIEDRICPLSSIELMLVFNSPNPDNDLQRVRLIQRLSARLRQQEQIEGTFSAATFAPRLPQSSSSVRGIIARRRASAAINRLKPELPALGLLAVEDGKHAWRLSMGVTNIGEIDYIHLAENVRKATNATFLRDGECVLPGERFSFLCTGRVPAINAVERQFLDDLGKSYVTAFAVVSVLILIVVRSAPACLLTTIPNLFPAVTVLGAIAVLDIPLDVTSMMTASVALGVAVDDTIHFTLWWRRRIIEGFPSVDAVVDAMQHCGAAMTQTSVVCGVSVALYGCCGFLPTVRFGLILSAMMFAALIGDLFLLPALLSTRLAQRMFAPTHRKVSRPHGLNPNHEPESRSE